MIPDQTRVLRMLRPDGTLLSAEDRIIVGSLVRKGYAEKVSTGIYRPTEAGLAAAVEGVKWEPSKRHK